MLVNFGVCLYCAAEVQSPRLKFSRREGGVVRARQDRRTESAAPAALARRLRELREQHSAEPRVTQSMVAGALGASTPLVSGWESTTSTSVPSAKRLETYARIFAVPRSLQDGKLRVLPDEDLTDEERADRDELFHELAGLREATLDRVPAAGTPRLNSWHFPDGAPVRIVAGKLGEPLYGYADPRALNYTELLQFADLDALVELFGHVRVQNPASDVRFQLAEALRPDDLTAHLVLIGGIYLNPASRWIRERIDLPVRQVSDPEIPEGEIFVVDEERFLPVIADDPELGLVEDIGLLVRTRNPNNSATTLTICNGVFSRGVLGAVRCLTDGKLRDQNEEYLSSRFANSAEFGVLMRVPVLQGNVATPDLTKPESRLYEWAP